MTKKIYYIAHCRFPSERAHAIQIAKMVEAMRLEGVDVELVLPKRPNQITQSPEAYYSLKTSLPANYLPILNLYRLGKLGYFFSGLSFVFSYWLFILGRRRHGEQFSLYTIDMDQFSLVGVSFIKAPFIIEVHDAKRKSWVFGRMFARAERIVAINNINKREIVKNFNLEETKVIVAPNGIDLELFSKNVSVEAWRREWHISKDRPFVLYVGKCYDWKGLDIFDKALTALPEVNFGFVGCTKAEVEALTGRKFDFKNALFFGQRPYSEMPYWMRSADLLLVIGTKKNKYSYLHTSLMKLFEYIATGVPVLAADTPAIKDMISEKEVFFYETDNTQSFVMKVKEILNNPELAKNIYCQAKLISPRFSWQSRVKLIFK